MKDLLSICCLGYNHALFLRENLESITKINHPNIEVIVVDDGSKDDSVAVLNELKQTFPLPLTVIAQENTGNIGKNFNTALRLAKGNLVAFIALDDVFNHKVVDSEIEMMLENEHFAFIAAKKAVSIDNEGLITGNLPSLPIAHLENISPKDLLDFEYSDFGAFYIQGCIFRKSVIDKIGGFDEDMTGDDIVLRTKLFRYLIQHPKWKYDFVAENNVFYRLHENNIHKNTFRQIRIVTEYLEKYWPERPNPKILTAWTHGAIGNKNLDEVFALFSINHRSAMLLSEQDIQKKITKLILKNNKIYKIYDKTIKKYLFNRKKITKSKREVVLFGFISFVYDKDKQCKTNVNPIHYSQYS